MKHAFIIESFLRTNIDSPLKDEFALLARQCIWLESFKLLRKFPLTNLFLTDSISAQILIELIGVLLIVLSQSGENAFECDGVTLFLLLFSLEERILVVELYFLFFQLNLELTELFISRVQLFFAVLELEL